MSWLDDLKTRAEQSVNNISKDITGYLGSIRIEPVVKIGEAPGGNQTAVQIQNGQFGGNNGAVPMAQAAANTLQNAAQASSVALAQVSQFLPLIILGVGAYLLFGRRRG